MARKQKNKENPQKTKKIKKNKRKKRTKKKTQKKQKKRAFQLSVNFFLFLVGVQTPFLTPWPKKRAPIQHYKNRGFSKFFLKSSYASRNGHFWTEIPNSRNSSYHFFCLFLLFQQQKTHKSAEPLFYSVFANLKKRIFKK